MHSTGWIFGRLDPIGGSASQRNGRKGASHLRLRIPGFDSMERQLADDLGGLERLNRAPSPAAARMILPLFPSVLLEAGVSRRFPICGGVLSAIDGVWCNLRLRALGRHGSVSYR